MKLFNGGNKPKMNFKLSTSMPSFYSMGYAFVGLCASLCALVAMCYETDEFGNEGPFSPGQTSGEAWPNVFLNFAIVLAYFLSDYMGTLHLYRIQLSIFNAASFALAVVTVNRKIYERESSAEAVGAAFLILAILNVSDFLRDVHRAEKARYSPSCTLQASQTHQSRAYSECALLLLSAACPVAVVAE